MASLPVACQSGPLCAFAVITVQATIAGISVLSRRLTRHVSRIALPTAGRECYNVANGSADTRDGVSLVSGVPVFDDRARGDACVGGAPRRGSHCVSRRTGVAVSHPAYPPRAD